jgi:predicted alpha/beta hydrolase family esterase
MKKVYIIHRWSGGPGSDWYPWLKYELEQKGYEVIVPQMPNTGIPIIGERVPFLSNIVGMPDENTYFVGHSIGAQTVIRYFETLPEGTKVGGAVFVAGWFKLGGAMEEEGEAVNRLAKPWTDTLIDFEKVKNICKNISALLSSNEPFNCVDENKKIFEEKLNATVTTLENKGHFTEDDGIKELPEALEKILEIEK